MGEPVNLELKGKIEKQIGELVTTDTFNDEVLSEGTDAVLFAFSTASANQKQDVFADEFIQLKQKFKRQRTRSVRFYAIDVNTDYKVKGLGPDAQMKVPLVLVFPAFHKKSNNYVYSSKPDYYKMAKFVQKHADIKLELKPVYFSPKSESVDEGLGGIKMDAEGNLKPDKESIMKI
mmetsp:Transcript_16561/g.28177  ORF Transcript_16561/g.28177 Transcript_16561/m.28177 type:complete len:176 (+) Transcript_16561:1367-1894(+)